MRPATSPFGTRIDSLTCPSNSNTVQNGSFSSAIKPSSLLKPGFSDYPAHGGRGFWIFVWCPTSAWPRVVGQFHDAARKTLNHQGHKVSRRLWFQALPSCTFVALVVNGFRKLTPTWPRRLI